jgi:hypothetical protein
MQKWMLFPPDCLPPGVYTDANEEEVTVPLALTDWFMQHCLEARRMRAHEALCEAGDVLFVPHLWWHTALNVEFGVALTHNYLAASGVRGSCFLLVCVFVCDSRLRRSVRMV